MVARALLLRPRVIVADEAVSMVDASLRATILENLLTLNTEFGISIIYITHDLTTAYQVGQNIVVLYQGAMVEAGDVELVIKDPKHPYTQLLVSSIPHPDPNKTWEDEEVASTPGKFRRGSSAMPVRRPVSPRHGRVPGTAAAAVPPGPAPGGVMLPLRGQTDARGR